MSHVSENYTLPPSKNPLSLPLSQAFALRKAGIFQWIKDLFTSRETKIRECAEAILKLAPGSNSQPRDETPSRTTDRLWRVSDKSWVCQTVDSEGVVRKFLLRLPSGAHGPKSHELVIQSIQLLKQQLNHQDSQILQDGLLFTAPSEGDRKEVWLLDPVRAKPSRFDPNLLRFEIRKIIPSAPPICRIPSALDLQAPFLSLNLDEMHRAEFSDPFTYLATECLAKYDSHFIEEKKPTSDYRFVIGLDGTLQLSELAPAPHIPDDYEKDQNRKVLAYYINFLTKNYGNKFVKKLEAAYELDFEQMLKDGSPLYPDHVFKCNIGVNNISIHDVEDTCARLKLIHAQLSCDESIPAETFLFNLFMQQSIPDLSLREARKLVQTLKQTLKTDHPSVGDLSRFLDQVTEDRSDKPVQKLTPSHFNAILHLLVSDEAELDRAFTGRKFVGQAIGGGPSRGSTRTDDPCKSLFHMLQIFQDCRKQGDYDNYYELLAQVAIKKIPLQKNPNTMESLRREFLLGFLIPAPVSQSGDEHWYSASYFQDDAGGNVNFVLEPSCEGYRVGEKRLPMIKLYRSTVPRPYAISWIDSLVADLNPGRAPGAADPRVSVPYETRYFRERTIPTWVGYTIAATRLSQENPQYHLFLEKAISHFRQYVANEKTDLDPDPTTLFIHLLDEKKYDELIQALRKKAEDWGEDPAHKISQDITFTGHSLGGNLAQTAMWDMVWKDDRVLMPGCEMLCSTFDAPATTRETNTSFMQFGHEHADLLQALDIKTTIKHQFEHGDWLSLAGESHLGISIGDRGTTNPWLNFSAHVFRPIPGSISPTISTLNKHSRRIGIATRDIDYALTPVTEDELRSHDHSFFLNESVARKFGYKYLRFARLVEFTRRRVGAIGRRLLGRFENIRYGKSRDPNKVYAIDEGHGYDVQT